MRSLYAFVKLDCWMNYVSWRFKVAVALQIVNIVILLWPLRALADYYQLPIGIGVLGILYSNDFFLLVSCVSLLLIFSNLPLTGTIQSYSRFRSSSLVWFSSQFVYIVLTSFLYTLITILTVIVSLFGRISFSFDWGKVLGSLAYYPGMAEEFNIDIQVPIEIISNMSSLEVILYAMSLLFLVGIFSGATILTLNFFKAGMGVTGYAFLVVFHQGIIVFGDYRLLFWTPLSWLSLTNLSTHSFDAYPSRNYAIIFLVLTIVIQGVIWLYYGMHQHEKLTKLFI